MPIPSVATFCDNNRFMQDQTRNQPDHPGERWVSVEELVGHLGVARDTVYRWIDQKGRLTPAGQDFGTTPTATPVLRRVASRLHFGTDF